jgi:hypothetical protein
MAVKCPCGGRARPGQRTCRSCHAREMKARRAEEASHTVYGYVYEKQFLAFKKGTSKGIVLGSEPGLGKLLTRIKVCKNHKKQ